MKTKHIRIAGSITILIIALFLGACFDPIATPESEVNTQDGEMSLTVFLPQYRGMNYGVMTPLMIDSQTDAVELYLDGTLFLKVPLSAGAITPYSTGLYWQWEHTMNRRSVQRQFPGEILWKNAPSPGDYIEDLRCGDDRTGNRIRFFRFTRHLCV